MTASSQTAPATVTAEHGLPVSGALTRDPRKQVLFGACPYFRQGWSEAEHVIGPGAAAAFHDLGLVLLKPDAVAIRHLDRTIDWLEERGAEIVHARRGSLGRHAVRAMWQFQMNAASTDRLEIMDLALADRPGLILLVRLPADPVPASVRLSAWKGPADPRKRRPEDLRSTLKGGNFLLSFVHTADEPADVVRELSILLGKVEREAVFGQLADPSRVDGADEARRVSRDLEADVPAHDLELETALTALERATPDGPARAPFLEVLAGVRRGELTDWRAVWRAADDAGVPPSRWDRAVVGTYLMPHSQPGVRQILGGVDPSLWKERSP